MFLAGVTRYRIANYAKAHDDFQRALAMTNDLETRAANFFWMGKTQQALGDSQAARAAWEQAASLDPTGYYSERAAICSWDRPSHPAGIRPVHRPSHRAC
jgi:tetratricopeptide (TPR) repeat protein